MHTLPHSGTANLANRIALELRVVGRPNQPAVDSLLDAAGADEDAFLDIVDLTLAYGAGYDAAVELKGILLAGGSVWRVNDDLNSLERRLSDEEQAAYREAASSDDEIAQELKTAWSAAYGRHPDPSDAWDHAIKAVEAALWPIVTPNNHKANLATIASHLGKQAEQFTLRLVTSSDRASNVETLAQMLRLMWPNPDRHATGSRRAPSLREAENVVQLAVLIVGWVRSSALATV